MKNKTITVDLEAWSPTVLSNTTGGIHPGKSMYMKMLKNRMYGGTNLCKEIVLDDSKGYFYAPYIPKIMKPKYKFSRAKWHTVDIHNGIWRLGREYNEIIEWCTEQFGKHPNKPDAWSRWWVGVGEIYFRDEKDVVFYKLKWA